MHAAVAAAKRLARKMGKVGFIGASSYYYKKVAIKRCSKMWLVEIHNRT